MEGKNSLFQGVNDPGSLLSRLIKFLKNTMNIDLDNTYIKGKKT